MILKKFSKVTLLTVKKKLSGGRFPLTTVPAQQNQIILPLTT